MEDGVDIIFIYFMKMLEKGESLKHKDRSSYLNLPPLWLWKGSWTFPRILSWSTVHKAPYCLGYTSKPVNINCKQKVAICWPNDFYCSQKSILFRGLPSGKNKEMS